MIVEGYLCDDDDESPGRKKQKIKVPGCLNLNIRCVGTGYVLELRNEKTHGARMKSAHDDLLYVIYYKLTLK